MGLTEEDYAELRERMVRRQIEARGIADPAILGALRQVPREAFVADAYAPLAYDDRPLPIGEGQTISQPYIVALMIEAAAIGAGDRVLEVGAGSGYAAAVVGQVAAEVIAIERHHRLAVEAGRRIAGLGYANVRIVEGDGTRGWPEAAPFDAILVAASARKPPQPLLDQLAIGGRLVLPVGGRLGAQRLVRIERKGERSFEREQLCGVRFVPLIGQG